MDPAPGKPLSPVKQALLALEELQARIDRMEHARREPIAIIGVGCRMPGNASDPESFWKLLRGGVDAICEIPPDRWDIDAFYDPDPGVPGKMNTRWGGFLRDWDVRGFDAEFFGIAPREASAMDPQQRLVLEVSWEALEHAGIAADRLAGTRAGVFVGASCSDYAQGLFHDASLIDAYHITGAVLNVLAGRVSYMLGVHGPSMVVDTACSSSLVTVHMACQSLRAGECDMAMAGGVNLILSPANVVAMTKTRMMAPDGSCKAFDAAADGFVRAEGCGMVVLKRLSDAQAAGDRILAVVRGSAVGHDGRGASFAAPNGMAQQHVIREALERAGVTPAEVSYVETHGTGTALGDPIEVSALAAVLGTGRTADNPLVLGSVKTNLGHLEAAAGIAGFIKTVLALAHGEIPPNLHFEQPNPHIDLAAIPARIPRQVLPWQPPGGRRIAGVSSFGLSGTNAHVVLTQAPALPAPPARPAAADDRPWLLPLSGRSAGALTELARRHRAFLGSTDLGLADVCYTASLRRSHHGHRLAVVGRSAEHLIQRIEGFLAGEADALTHAAGREDGEQPGVVFVFPGQGSEWAGVGRELLHREPLFRETVLRCDQALRGLAAWSVLELIEAGDARFDLSRADLAQPALLAVQIGLCALLESWGIVPDAVVGHSVGEVAAAYAAGVLGLEDAMRVVFHRGRLVHARGRGGRMAAVALGQAEMTRRLSGRGDQVSIAVINSPETTVISGEATAVAAFVAELQAEGVFCRLLDVDYASHSVQMGPVQAELATALAGLVPRPASRMLVSSVTAAIEDGRGHDGAYWGRNLREPVRFRATLDVCVDAGQRVFVELSPHPMLVRSIEQCLAARGVGGAALATLRRGQDEQACMLATVAGLYAHGHAVDWARLYPVPGRCVTLPRYPWQEKRYWQEVDLATACLPAASGQAAAQARHALLGRPLPTLAHLPEHRVWQLDLDAAAFPYLRDHRILDTLLVPASAYVDMVLAAASEAASGQEVRDLTLLAAMELPAQGSREVQLALMPAPGPGEAIVEVRSRLAVPRAAAAEDAWTLHVRGTLVRAGARSGAGNPALRGHALPGSGDSPESLRTRLGNTRTGEDLYRELGQRGLGFGPSFQGIRRLWWQGSEALGEIQLAGNAAAQVGRYRLHPALLDACFQVVFTTLGRDSTASAAHVAEPVSVDDGAYLPLGIDSVRLDAAPGARVWCHARRIDVSGAEASDTLSVDYTLFDDSGRPIGEITGMRLRRTSRAALQRVLDMSRPGAPGNDSGGDAEEQLDRWLYQVAWQPQPLAAQASGAAPGRWLVLTDGQGVADALVDALAQRGHACVRVRPGAVFAHFSDGSYELDPARPEDVERLVAETLAPMLAKAPAGPGAEPAQPWLGIVHLWALDVRSADELLSADQRRSLGSVVTLAQILARRGLAVPLWLVTRGAQAVAGTAPAASAVAQAPLWGLGRVLALEHPELLGGLVDLDPAAMAGEQAALLAAQLASAHDGVRQLAFRGAERLAAQLVRGPALRPAPLSLRADASYLIAGGLGGLGLRVVRWLVEHGARHLVILGRSEPSAAARQELSALEAAGARISVVRGDVASLDDVAAAIVTAERAAPLAGVIHAAAMLADAALLGQDWARFARVLAPKVEGSWNLHRATRDRTLDFFVMFASASALLGPPGQGNYAAANAFQDALAQVRRAQGLPALSIDWGVWAEVGLAAERGVDQRTAGQGMGSMSPAQALEVLTRMLGAPDQLGAQAAVLPDMDWQRFHVSFAHGREPRFYAPLLAEQATAGKARNQASAGQARGAATMVTTGESVRERLARATVGERLGLLAGHVGEHVIRVLGLDRAEPAPLRRGFTDMGMDSIMAIELKNRLQASVGKPLPATVAFDHPTIERLAEHLLGLLEQEGLAHSSAPADMANKQAMPQVEAAAEIPASGQAAGRSTDLATDRATDLAAAGDVLGDVLAELDGLSDDEALAALVNGNRDGGAE